MGYSQWAPEAGTGTCRVALGLLWGWGGGTCDSRAFTLGLIHPGDWP